MRRRRRAFVARSMLVGSSVMAVGFVGAYAAAAPEARTASVPVMGNDAGQALFDAATLVPDHVYRQCISVSATSSSDADAVDLVARSVTGPLAPHLQVTVEMGDGGGHDDHCAGFDAASAVPVFTGTLQTLGAGAVSTGWHPATASRHTFRISVSLDGSDVSGQEASADFVWSLTSTDEPVTPVDPTPPVDPTTPADPTTPQDHGTGSSSGGSSAGGDGTSSGTPATVTESAPVSAEDGTAVGTAEGTSPSATAGAGTTAAGTGSATAGAGARPTPSATGSPLGGGDSPTIPTDDSSRGDASSSSGSTGGALPGGNGSSGRSSRPADLDLGSPLAAARATVARAGKALARVTTSPQYPLLAVALAVGFLAVQDQIDRRDPKLALASRRQRDNDVEFPDIFGAVR